MPNHEEHCVESLKRYGELFSEPHSWMDEPSLLLGASHRKYRYDTCIHLELMQDLIFIISPIVQ